MKEINIKIVIDEQNNKIATAKRMVGYSNENILHQLELLGIFQNLVDMQQKKINTLGKWSKSGTA